MNNGKEKINLIKKINLAIILFVLVILPLMVRIYLVSMPNSLRDIWGSFINIDFFSFYKMVWLLVMSSILLFVFFIYIFRNKLIRTGFYIPLFIFSFFAVISALLSEYSFVVWYGLPDRHESLLVLLAYIFLVIAAINLVEGRKTNRIVIGSLFISAAVLAVHGLMQFFGFDFFLTDIGRRLIASEELRTFVNEFHLHHSDKRAIYSTMYNPNYVGSYGAMLVPLLLGFYLNSGKLKKYLIYGTLSVLLFAFLVGSQSRAGMVGFMAGVFVLALVMRWRLLERWRPALIILVAFALVLTGMDVYSVDDVIGEIVSPTTEPDLIEEELERPPLQDIRADGSRLTIETAASELNLSYEDGLLRFRDEEGERITYSVDRLRGNIYLDDDRYRGHSFLLNPDVSRIEWNYDGRETVFKYQDGEFYMEGMHGTPYEIEHVPSWGFSGYERLGSGRGYIWSRSIPMLRDTLILGYGPDAYALYFPQEDVVGKRVHINNARTIVDKPHNLYLQKALNTGLPSLLALLALWGYYLLQSVRLYRDADFSGWRPVVGAAIAAAVAGYLAAGFFNDSVVSVAPVFWTLLGIGIGVNIRYKRRR